jgi:hypothetical protein
MYETVYEIKNDNNEQNNDLNDKFLFNIYSNQKKYLNINQNISNNLNFLNYERLKYSFKEKEPNNDKEKSLLM